MMADFDPQTQTITLLAADGQTEIPIPLAMVDMLNHEGMSVCISYGSQLGACFVMLVVLLILTPSAKLRRPSSVLHMLGLLVCTIRMALLSAWWPSPFNDFYAFWANDYSHLSSHDFGAPVAAQIFSLLLVIVIEAALMYQAWTMVSLWPSAVKATISAASASITLLTIGWRIAFTVIQTQAVLTLEPPGEYYWLIHWMIITNLVSICWFCALFNVKLVLHLLGNRGILPSHKKLTPLEILVMTNGVLMIVPVIFAGLEWGRFTNFEAASLTLTSVAIILPLGTLAAQRMAHTTNLSNNPEQSTPFQNPLYDSPNSTTRLKDTVLSSRSQGQGSPLPQGFVTSHCEASVKSNRRHESGDLELGYVGSQSALLQGRVRVDHDLEQHVDRI